MMMYPNAPRGYMPFAPSYEQRKKQHQRQRHKSAENKKNLVNVVQQKSNSLPALGRSNMVKRTSFMSVPDLDKSKEVLDKDTHSILAQFLNLFKKSKKHKLPSKSSSPRQRSDSDKENGVYQRRHLESIMEEEESQLSLSSTANKKPKTDHDDNIDSSLMINGSPASSFLSDSSVSSVESAE